MRDPASSKNVINGELGEPTPPDGAPPRRGMLREENEKEERVMVHSPLSTVHGP